MATIYTQQLFNGVVTAGAGVLYTVPSGKLAIVTDIDRISVWSAANQVTEVVIGSAVLAIDVSTASGFLAVQWTGRQVLNAGQQIQYVHTGTELALAITGYVLDLP